MERTATFSPCMSYRYRLGRSWGPQTTALHACMLNPSKADTERDDHTITKLINFARAWGYGALEVVNLYAFRTKDPGVMYAQADPVGPDNDRAIDDVIAAAAASPSRKLLVAWGDIGKKHERAARLVDAAIAAGVELICLGHTADGHPKHPQARGLSSIPRDQKPLRWKRLTY